MAQVNNPALFKKLAAGALVTVAAALCVNLLFSPAPDTQLDVTAMSLMTTEGSFRTARGDGSRAIHVFLSSECSYCHKIESELDSLENVTVHRHMLPGTTERARRVAIDVWCSSDPVKAWKKVAAGQPGESAKCDGTVLEKNLELARRFNLAMTPSIVYEDGHVSTGMLSSGEIAERITRASSR